MKFYGRETCLNGHVTSHYVGSGFESRQPFCSKCGAATITDCPSCKAAQIGSPVESMGIPNKHPDAYCWKCGKPYPWTEQRLAAITEMVKEEEHLSEEDKQLLTSSLSDLTSDSPRTALAATRFKRIVGKTGIVFKNAMYKFLVDCTSETAKKIVMGE